MSDYDNILLEEPEPGIRVLTVNRPRALNALNRATIAGLHAAARTLPANDPARAGSRAYVQELLRTLP